MPLPLSVPIGLLVGMSLAWLARVELGRSEVPLVLARPFLVALALGALVYGPIAAYFVLCHADWSYLYLVRPNRIPSAIDLVLVVFAALQVPLGFAAAAPWAMAKRGPALVKVGGVVAALVVIACVVAARRLGTSASYAQYHGGFGVAPLGKTSLGRGILLSWVALMTAYAWSARVLRAATPN